MSCNKYEQDLFESFGVDSLSDELKKHIQTCASCNDIFNNLQSVTSEIGSDDLFYESDEVVAKRVDAVNTKIDELELFKVIDPKTRWKSYVPMAAALFLIVGVGLITKLTLHFDGSIQSADNSKPEITFVSLTDDDTKSLAEIDISEFVDDYNTEFSLDEMSEEEYKYLEENLNIGEIL